jgi:type I restriction enzyme R subunit
MDRRGNAMLVCSSIYQACKTYELFSRSDLAGKCAIVTSYKPGPADIKGEESGEGETEKLHQYAIYRKMLADYFNEPEDRPCIGWRSSRNWSKTASKRARPDAPADCGG